MVHQPLLVEAEAGIAHGRLASTHPVAPTNLDAIALGAVAIVTPYSQPYTFRIESESIVQVLGYATHRLPRPCYRPSYKASSRS